jgi:hypothetical protein
VSAGSARGFGRFGFREQRRKAQVGAGLDQCGFCGDDCLVAFGEAGLRSYGRLFQTIEGDELTGAEVDLSAIGRGSAQGGPRDQGGDAGDLDAIDTDLGDGREELVREDCRTRAAVSDDRFVSGPETDDLSDRFVIRGIDEVTA